MDIDVNMDIRACTMLREFHLDCWKFPEGLDPEDFCLNFPHLETLLLGPYQTLKPIKISAPTDASKNLESSNLVLVPKIDEVNRDWFHKLRSHLENFSNYDATLDLRLRDERKTSPREHPRSKPGGRVPSQPLHHIKYQQEYLMRYIIDNLLWMSHPNTLTLSVPTSFAAPLAQEVSKQLYGGQSYLIPLLVGGGKS
ncbi:hypothetical protein P3L10_007944 [Capsicum annuum]|uniref:uncharacterized protein LOC107865873 n=1 Tax=Capsicum annuum TaxID=4072 RepID=UPI001FB0FFC0|nr:uncharacterized protein LOC107865873 [Capsicum annuum]